MYLVFEQALVTRSSSSILFFKKMANEDGEVLWTQYHELADTRGQIYFIKGNIRIQIVCDDVIYFYLIDKETFMPQLENVMQNFMRASQMMFGPRVRFGITYRQNQPGFMVYTRKYGHNFKVPINSQNWEGAIGSNLKFSYAYIMALKNRVIITDQSDFRTKQEWEVPVDRPGIEILYIIVSEDEKKVGMTLGRYEIKDAKTIDKIVIYKKDHTGEYALEKKFAFPFPTACIQFCFDRRNTNFLTFFSQESVFRFDYTQPFKSKKDLKVQTLYKIENQCDEPPSYGYFNSDQTKFILTSK